MYGRNRAKGPLSAASVLVHPSAKNTSPQNLQESRRRRHHHRFLLPTQRKPPHPLPPAPCLTRLHAFPLNNDWGSERGGWQLHAPIRTTSAPAASPLEVFRIMGAVADQRLISSHWYSRRRLFIHLWKDIHILLQCACYCLIKGTL